MSSSSNGSSGYRDHTADAPSSSVQISSLSQSGDSRRLQSTTSVKVKLGSGQSKFDSRAHQKSGQKSDEKSRIQEILLAAKQANISLEALTRAKNLFRGYRNVSEVHSWEIGLIYCKFVINYDEKKEAKEADEKKEGVCKKISKKLCSTRYPLFGKEGLDKHDDFDITEDKECCCGRILYRTHNRINNYIMFLQHHKMEFLTLKLLIELAKLKHNLAYRMYTNFMSRKILLFVSMLLMPFLILLSMLTLDSRNAYILSGSSDIFSYMTMWKYFYLALCIPLYYIFVCLSIARLDFNRQICYAGIFMVLGVAILSGVTLIYLKEIKYLPIKPNYRLEQFRQAISRWDVDEYSRFIVNSTQRSYRCCGLESYKDYYDDVNFEYSKEVQVSDNLDKPSKDTSHADIRKEKLNNKKKIPASCFTSKINATMFRMNKHDKITPFGFGDVIFHIQSKIYHIFLIQC
ncbi:MAG: hypothetical protein MHMPM18_000847 [Marteilia pararefringens]